MLVGFGYSQSIKDSSWAPALSSTEHIYVHLGNKFWPVCNYNMNVLNISVLLAWDYMSRVRDGTLNLCACYDRNVYAFYNHSKLSGYGYVWINMVKVFIWCMSPC